MTPPDELTRRAREEVNKELGDDSWAGLNTMFDRAYALSVRLMRYKLQVREAEKEMEEKVERHARARDMDWRGSADMLAILTKHTQEEQ